MASVPADPTLFTRIGLAFACLFRVLFDARFAGRVQRLEAAPELPQEAQEDPTPEPPAAAEQPAPKAEPKVDLDKIRRDGNREGGLLLLGMLQREGRLIDFVQQSIDDFDDDDVGAAARQVHEGCRRALKNHAHVSELHEAAEESVVTVPADYDAASFKLTGKVTGDGPYRGKLVHRGWRVSGLSLPELLDGHDGEVVAPAEVEL